MSVVKTSNGRWRVKLKAGRRDVVSKTFSTKREAIAWLKKQTSLMNVGVDVHAAKTTTVGEALRDWLVVRRGMVAESTVKTDESVVRNLPKSIQAYRVGDVTGAEFHTYLSSLPCSVGRRDRIRISLSAFFTWCVKNGLRADNPLRGLRLKSGVREVMNPFSWGEVAGVVSSITQPEYKRVVLVAAYTGLRWGELRGLLVKDVRMVGDRMVLSVVRSHSEGVSVKDVKQSQARVVPVPEAAVWAVREAVLGKGRLECVFTSPAGGLLDRGNFRRDAWDSVRAGRSIQDLRHTAISEWVRHGVPLSTVKAWAGHASLATTNGYVHYQPCHGLDAVDLLS